jgi:hypothetical protein
MVPGGEHEFRLFWSEPSEAELAAAQRGLIELKLLVEEEVIFIVYRIGDQPWSDCTFSWWLVPEAERAMPNPEPGAEERALMHFLLIDGSTGIIRVLRSFTMSPRFTAALGKAIREQAARPFDLELHEAAIQRVYARYPSSKEMARASTIRTFSGD